jgi:hypothetical protein
MMSPVYRRLPGIPTEFHPLAQDYGHAAILDNRSNPGVQPQRGCVNSGCNPGLYGLAPLGHLFITFPESESLSIRFLEIHLIEMYDDDENWQMHRLQSFSRYNDDLYRYQTHFLSRGLSEHYKNRAGLRGKYQVLKKGIDQLEPINKKAQLSFAR